MLSKVPFVNETPLISALTGEYLVYSTKGTSPCLHSDMEVKTIIDIINNDNILHKLIIFILEIPFCLCEDMKHFTENNLIEKSIPYEMHDGYS